MTGSLRLCKVLWSMTTALTLVAALSGVFVREIYVGVFASEYLPGALSQDILTLLVCALLFVLIASTKERDVKKQIVVTGLVGSLFYLYGIFTIERVYNWLYLVYAIVFALSFWSIVYTLSRFSSGGFSRIRLDDKMLKLTAVSSIIIALLFTVLWTMALIPLMRDHNRIEFLYSIYILDLCFIMPAFVITAVMSLRKMPLGILMAPALMILGFFVIFPLGLNELAKPSYGMVSDYGSMAMSFLFSAFMLSIGVIHLRMIRIE